MLFDDEEFDPYDDIAETGSASEGLKEPHQSDLMIGHEAIETQLIGLINSNKMPHAIIFSGEEGVGKFTMAQRLARALLAHGIDDPSQDSLFGGDAPRDNLQTLEVKPDHPIFSKVASKGHPDLLTIERSIDSKTQKRKNEINVETARKVAPFLRMTSADGGWRIVIVNDADKMNRNAQNSILKILEEPPKHTLTKSTHRVN
ncbi:MAG: ATP-binding protein, partial [Pseudomonadota bacterium]